MILIDSTAKTARIPVKVVDGKFINQITKQEVAGIESGSYCEIIVEGDKIFDFKLLDLLMDETVIELLPKDSLLYATVNHENIPENLKDFAVRPKNVRLRVKEKVVEVILKSPLYLKFRGTKPPILLDCLCDIPALRETKKDYEMAESLNHAYTLISTAFEPQRRSHAGNVFLKVFYESQEENPFFNKWSELKDLREIKTQDYYKQLSEKYQELKNKD